MARAVPFSAVSRNFPSYFSAMLPTISRPSPCFCGSDLSEAGFPFSEFSTFEVLFLTSMRSSPMLRLALTSMKPSAAPETSRIALSSRFANTEQISERSNGKSSLIGMFTRNSAPSSFAVCCLW